VTNSYAKASYRQRVTHFTEGGGKPRRLVSPSGRFERRRRDLPCASTEPARMTETRDDALQPAAGTAETAGDERGPPPRSFARRVSPGPDLHHSLARAGANVNRGGTQYSSKAHFYCAQVSFVAWLSRRQSPIMMPPTMIAAMAMRNITPRSSSNMLASLSVLGSRI
jgi:hypothetical protein